jgi:hypothetical protein
VFLWIALTKEEADRWSTNQQLAGAFFALAYKVGAHNLPQGQSARQFARNQLDRLGIGQDKTHFYWGKKRYTLPPSRMTAPG